MSTHRKPTATEHAATMSRLEAHPDVTISASFLDAESSDTDHEGVDQ